MALTDAIKLIKKLGGGHIYPYGISESCQDEYDRMYLIRWIIKEDGFLYESIPSDNLPTKYKLAPLSIFNLTREDYIVEADNILYE